MGILHFSRTGRFLGASPGPEFFRKAFLHRWACWYAAWGMLILMWLLVCVFPSDAQPPPPQETENSRQIYITADKLVTDHHHQTAEFIGNVRARQNETLILSDRMTIFYQAQDTPTAQEAEIGSQAMRKIEADGHVRITMQDTTGMAAHAVYTAKDRILVLSGAGSRLVRGENTISGNKIVFNRIDGTITVESGREERVEAVIFSEDNGL